MRSGVKTTFSFIGALLLASALLIYGWQSRRLAGEAFSLFGEMLGNPPVEPTLDLGGQVQDFECHGFSP
jgi:hypothetical protein